MPYRQFSAVRRSAAQPAGLIELYLAAIPLLDVVLNQAGNVADLRVWSLSIFQAVRGILLIVNLGIVAPLLAKANRGTFVAVLAVSLYPISLTCSAVVETASRSAVAPETVVAVLQSYYWVTVLALVLLRIERGGTWRVIENGIMLGAAAAAVSVVAAFLGGGLTNPYQLSGVDASWGWFLTMKGLTGQLLVGAVVGTMVGRERRAWWAYSIAGACALASFLTYSRTGLVALALGCAWLLTTYRRKRALVLARDLALIGLAAFLLLSIPRVQTALTDNLTARWRDVLDETMREHGKAGSGRATLLPDAWTSFASGDAGEIWMGRGFAGMLDTVEKAGYIRIHTHNDLLDVLLVGGIEGLLALILLLAVVWRRLMPPFSMETRWRYSFAILLVWSSHAALTGQLWLPDAMAWYVLGLAVLATSAKRERMAQVNAAPRAQSKQPAVADAAFRRPLAVASRTAPGAQSTGSPLPDDDLRPLPDGAPRPSPGGTSWPPPDDDWWPRGDGSLS